MERKQLVRDIKQAALDRMEATARTVEDFQAVIEQWDHLDANRERREDNHEKKCEEETIRLGYSDGMIFPVPVRHPAWHKAINGDFLDMIYDNAEDMWQLVEDQDIATLIKALPKKQKEVLFLSAVRLCTPQQIACYLDKTDRAVRKLLTAAIDGIREKLASIIREQITAQAPNLTLEKRRFLEWYDKEKSALDKSEHG